MADAVDYSRIRFIRGVMGAADAGLEDWKMLLDKVLDAEKRGLITTADGFALGAYVRQHAGEPPKKNTGALHESRKLMAVHVMDPSTTVDEEWACVECGAALPSEDAVCSCREGKK